MARDIDRVMKCKECGADPIAYWLSRNPNASVLTPNGETIYCVLKGNPEKAHGISYTLHTCIQVSKEVDVYG